MDDKTIYGKCIGKYSAGIAIKNKHLCDYQIVTLYSTQKYIDSIVKKDASIKDIGIVDTHYLASAILLLHAMRDGIAKHVVSYHGSIQKSKQFMKLLEKLIKLFDMDVKLYQLDGSSSMHKRTKVLKEFEDDDLAIIVNVKVLNEGINAPVIDGICFVDKKESTIDIMQCFGRALPLHGKKDCARIFIPIMFEDMNNIDETTSFGNLIKLSKSLKEADTRIVEYFRMKRKGLTYDRKMIEYKGYVEEGIEIEEVKVNDWIKNIEYRVWKTIGNWENIYDEVKDWIEKHGKLPNQKAKDPIERKYGIWCNHQRTNKDNRGKEKTEMLNKMPYWHWGFDDKWARSYKKVCDYIKEHGHLPRACDKDKEVAKLGLWCGDQRKFYNRGTLQEKRKEILENTEGWTWTHKEVKHEKWFERCAELKKYVDENKKFPSESSPNKDTRLLGSWRANQSSYKRYLEDKQIKALEAIPNWKWSSYEIDNNKKNHKPKEDVRTWDDSYQRVKAWTNKYKELPKFAKDGTKEELRLAEWCRGQKKKHKNGILSQDKIKKLETIPNWKWLK